MGTGALFSLPISGTSEMIKKLNHNLAELIKYNTNKYGFLALIPLGEIDDAIKEVDFAANQLRAEGFIVTTNFKGTHLGSDKLVPLLEKLNHKNVRKFANF